jgi:hypothetical protein
VIKANLPQRSHLKAAPQGYAGVDYKNLGCEISSWRCMLLTINTLAPEIGSKWKLLEAILMRLLSPYKTLNYYLVFLILFIIFEVSLVSVGGNFGAFWWTTLHFILLPVASFIFIVWIIFHNFKQGSSKERFWALAIIGFQILLLYFAFSLGSHLIFSGFS